MTTKTKQYITMCLLSIWGLCSFIVLAGDEIPGQPISDLKFYGSKAIALASIWLCFRTGKWLGKKGLIPEIKEEE